MNVDYEEQRKNLRENAGLDNDEDKGFAPLWSAIIGLAIIGIIALIIGIFSSL